MLRKYGPIFQTFRFEKYANKVIYILRNKIYIKFQLDKFKTIYSVYLILQIRKCNNNNEC